MTTADNLPADKPWLKNPDFFSLNTFLFSIHSSCRNALQIFPQFLPLARTHSGWFFSNLNLTYPKLSTPSVPAVYSHLLLPGKPASGQVIPSKKKSWSLSSGHRLGIKVASCPWGGIARSLQSLCALHLPCSKIWPQTLLQTGRAGQCEDDSIWNDGSL